MTSDSKPKGSPQELLHINWHQPIFKAHPLVDPARATPLQLTNAIAQRSKNYPRALHEHVVCYSLANASLQSTMCHMHCTSAAVEPMEKFMHVRCSNTQVLFSAVVVCCLVLSVQSAARTDKCSIPNKAFHNNSLFHETSGIKRDAVEVALEV